MGIILLVYITRQSNSCLPGGSRTNATSFYYVPTDCIKLILALKVVQTTIGFLPFDRAGYKEEKDLKTNSLGRLYKDGEAIVNQGERGDCMYVVQSGRVKVVRLMNGREVKISELSKGDCFGEMALFDHNVRSATVCSIGESRILTVDKNNFLRWIQKDLSMAFQIMQTANDRVCKLTDQVSRMKDSDRRDWKSRPDKK